jgi:hypothetical protein
LRQRIKGISRRVTGPTLVLLFVLLEPEIAIFFDLVREVGRLLAKSSDAVRQLRVHLASLCTLAE